MTINLKRAYAEPSEADGFRVLVDRLWPRGISKEELALDRWMKEIAPSHELRQWFDHDPNKWDEFRKRYREKLEEQTARIEFLQQKHQEGTLTLVYAAKDTERNNAVVLREYLLQKEEEDVSD